MADIKRNLEGRIESPAEHISCSYADWRQANGKTTLSRAIRPAWHYFDLENAATFDFITRDYDFFFREYPRHVILDEAQECPDVFRQLRGIVDQTDGKPVASS